jgi:hypothetical protein
MNLAGVAGASPAMPAKAQVPQQNASNTMKMTAIQAVSMVSALTLIGFPATAYVGGPPNPAPSPSPTPGQFPQFQNSSQNISCNLGSGGAVCEIGNRAYTISTPPPPCAQHSAWGDRFSLDHGGVTMDCRNDTIHVQGEPVVNNGQTQSAGTFSCTPDTESVRCTDSSSGHFFFMSPSSCHRIPTRWGEGLR